ncbi:MAG TPA: isoaspartyl peptidase/L-asparaginase, partial [Phenylobacterium sp.]|nr:isoaspartyl peptidase/L-asparaginase [Phenylobacterium sp.]
AVAVDIHGHVAAATSTGGMTGKRWGRIGDSPVIGAGTYASDQACAVSATGSGEFFIRLAVAHEIAALVRHKGLSLQAAADAVVQDQLTALGGDGGVIAAGPDGALAWSFNTSGMYRARLAAGGAPVIGVYKDDF